MSSGRPPTIAPPADVFTQRFVVLESDIDALGHANNIAYVRWVQDVAIAHSAAVGFDFAAYAKVGGVFVIRRQEIDYIRPSKQGDPLELRTWLGAASPAKFLRITEIAREDGTLVAKALTTWGYVQLATGRPLRVPQVLIEAFNLTIRESIFP